MTIIDQTKFNSAAFLAQVGLGRRSVRLKIKETFFAQGDPADCVFYLQDGRVKLTVTSQEGKEGTIALLAPGDFIGEEAMAATPGLRTSTATAIGNCSAIKIERADMARILHQEHEFFDEFLKYLLDRSIRTQADIVNQLFNSCEKRLARTLLLLAECGQPDEPMPVIPKISQETLAEMVGTTRSRVSFFMNRFRKNGIIEYKGGIQVNKSLLNLVLHD